MKRLLLLALCLCTLPLCAQQSSYDQRRLPAAYAEALLEIPSLEQAQNQAKAGGYELAAADQERLERALHAVKGLTVVEIGYPSCSPCKALLAALEEPDGSGVSLLSRWQNSGISFYQMHWLRARRATAGAERLERQVLELWGGVESSPVLLFIKDGKEVARLKGFDSSRTQEQLAAIKNTAAQFAR